jgi:hypothetical protein
MASAIATPKPSAAQAPKIKMRMAFGMVVLDLFGD